MRHRKRRNNLSMNTTKRKALLLSLVRSLFLYEQITTTYKRAKAAALLADKLITLGRENTATAKKTAISILRSKELIGTLFGDIAPRFVNRRGGYTRILHLMPRHGDGAEMAIMELTERKIVEKKRKTKEAKMPKEEKAESAKPPISTALKEKIELDKSKEKAKSEGQKLQHGFLKNLRGYFRRKSG